MQVNLCNKAYSKWIRFFYPFVTLKAIHFLFNKQWHRREDRRICAPVIMKILFIGDICGKPGRQAVEKHLPELRKQETFDFIIANGENAAGGHGLTGQVAQDLFQMGIHILTTGNHIWDKKDIYEYIETEDRILRPLNFPPAAPGKGWGIYSNEKGERLGIINLIGRVFMAEADCPFRSFQDHIQMIRQETSNILVDFHAEATAEKKALLYYCNGTVSALLGTHTHVQTRDAQITPEGTAYITDVGMTGVQDSIIGVRPKEVVEKFLTGLPNRFQVAKGQGIINAVILEIDPMGKGKKIRYIPLMESC